MARTVQTMPMVRSSFYLSSFSMVCSKCDISAAMGSDGTEGEYR
jgi:hypothetical protein